MVAESRGGWLKKADQNGRPVNLPGGKDPPKAPGDSIGQRRPANQGQQGEQGIQQGAGGQQQAAGAQPQPAAAGTGQVAPVGTAGAQAQPAPVNTGAVPRQTGTRGRIPTQQGDDGAPAPRDDGAPQQGDGGVPARQTIQGQSGGSRQPQADPADGTAAGRNTGTLPKLEPLHISTHYDTGDTINVNPSTGSVFQWRTQTHLPSQARPASASQPLNPNAPPFVPGQSRPGPYNVPGLTFSEPPPRNILAFARGNKIVHIRHDHTPPLSPHVLPKEGMKDAFTQMTFRDHPAKPSGDYADVSGLSTLTDQLFQKISKNPPGPHDNVHPHHRQFMDFHKHRKEYAKEGIFFDLDARLNSKFPKTPLQKEHKFLYQRPITRAKLNTATPKYSPPKVTVAPPTKAPRKHTPTEHVPMEFMKVVLDKHKQLHHHKYDPKYNPPSE